MELGSRTKVQMGVTQILKRIDIVMIVMRN